MSGPIPMILHCFACGTQHIDKPEPENGWNNPPHRSHLCHVCGTIWRPADVPTVGVEQIETRGDNDIMHAPIAGFRRQLAESTAREAALREALGSLTTGAQIVLAGLDARIDRAVAEGGRAVPVFNGIADLHDAIGQALAAMEEKPT